MFALVDKSDNSITRMYNGNRGITLGDLQYPRAIYTLWTEAERNAINIYTVTIDESKRKDEQWYINTNITYAFDGTNATGSYGDATAKAHADTLFTAQDETDGKGTEGEVATRGLKYNLIQTVKAQAEGELNRTDFLVMYQSVFANSLAACALTVCIKLYFNPLVLISPSVPKPSVSSCAVNKVSACFFAVALP